jgi:hypothetical protein
MKKLPLIVFLFFVLLMGLVIGANAQKRTLLELDIHEDSVGFSVVYKEGNTEGGFDYLTMDQFNEFFSDKITGEYFKDRSGKKYPILLSVNQKKFILRKSATGNWYRSYIK